MVEKKEEEEKKLILVFFLCNLIHLYLLNYIGFSLILTYIKTIETFNVDYLDLLNKFLNSLPPFIYLFIYLFLSLHSFLPNSPYFLNLSSNYSLFFFKTTRSRCLPFLLKFRLLYKKKGGGKQYQGK